MGISLYSINRKYLIKFEKSDCEISIKVPEEEFASLEDLEKKIQEPAYTKQFQAKLQEIEEIRDGFLNS